MPAKLLKPIARVFMRILFRVRVVGGLGPVHLGGHGAERVLIIANHESFLDGVILALFLPADPVFVVHTYVAENRWFRLGLRLVDFLTLDPTSPLAMRQVVRLLESGRPVLIFPEGRITTTGSLMKVYDGPAFAAVKTGAAIGRHRAVLFRAGRGAPSAPAPAPHHGHDPAGDSPFPEHRRLAQAEEARGRGRHARDHAGHDLRLRDQADALHRPARRT